MEEKLIKNNLIDYSILYHQQDKTNMNSERSRLQTFKDWPNIQDENPLAIPSNLARAGLYYQPIPSQINTGILFMKIIIYKLYKGEGSTKIVGMDRCVCFRCKAVFSGWESLGDPW